MNRAVLVVLVAVVGWSTCCSQAQNDKSAIQASATAALSNQLKKGAIVMHLYIGRVGRCTPIVNDNPSPRNVPQYRAAEKAGLITITPDGPGFWKVDLVNPKPNVLESFKKITTQKEGCVNTPLAFTLATKVASSVQVHPVTSDKAVAEFTWKWNLEPFGVKLVDSLSTQERAELDPTLAAANTGRPDPTFRLADPTASSVPHPAKMTLKTSGETWVVDESSSPSTSPH